MEITQEFDDAERIVRGTMDLDFDGKFDQFRDVKGGE
jgi:hypothetical protein